MQICKSVMTVMLSVIPDGRVGKLIKSIQVRYIAISSLQHIRRNTSAYAVNAACLRAECFRVQESVAELKKSPGPALCIAVACGVPSMVHRIKAVDVVPIVGCKDLVTTSTEFDTGQEGCPALVRALVRQKGLVADDLGKQLLTVCDQAGGGPGGGPFTWW